MKAVSNQGHWREKKKHHFFELCFRVPVTKQQALSTDMDHSNDLFLDKKLLPPCRDSTTPHQETSVLHLCLNQTPRPHVIPSYNLGGLLCQLRFRVDHFVNNV